jgi:hypothetical protein
VPDFSGGYPELVPTMTESERAREDIDDLIAFARDWTECYRGR